MKNQRTINNPVTQLFLGAAENNDWESAQNFISEGALTNGVDENGNTAIMLFAKAGNMKSVISLAKVMDKEALLFSNDDCDTVKSILCGNDALNDPEVVTNTFTKERNFSGANNLITIGFKQPDNYGSLVDSNLDIVAEDQQFKEG